MVDPPPKRRLARAMKTKIHLFYGIVIGILLCASFGSIKKDKAEFKEELLLDSIYTTTKQIPRITNSRDPFAKRYDAMAGGKVISQRSQPLAQFNKSLMEYKKAGWTIIDITTLNVRLVNSQFTANGEHHKTEQISYEPVYYAHLAR
jgi:hypothetical protein